jgi:hypothetical protein
MELKKINQTQIKNKIIMAYKQNSPFKQSTQVTKKSSSIPGYKKEAGGNRKGIINLDESSSGVERENFTGDTSGGSAWKKGYDRCLQDPTQEGCSGYVKYEPAINKKYNEMTASKNKNFVPESKTTPGSPGTEVDTFTSPQARESLRRGKVNLRGERQRGRKAARSARRLERMFEKTGSLDLQDKEGNWTTLKGDDATNYLDQQKGRAESLKRGGGAIGQTQFANDEVYTAGEVSQGNSFNVHNRPTVEAYKDIKKATEGGEEPVYVTDTEGYTDYDSIETGTTVVSSGDEDLKEDNTALEMKSSAFKMKYKHSPAKMYSIAKEKSSALKMWGANKVEDGNKLFFDKSAFKSESSAARPMTKKASSGPFKMRGYGK